MFPVEHLLSGWTLAWCHLELVPGAEDAATAARGRFGAAAARAGIDASDTTVAAVRRLFRDAGTDPTRYRPSSEALIRRLTRGEALPAIHPLVDLNNCVSVALRVPSCVMAAESLVPRVRLRRGEAGERMASLRGDFDLAGKPLLEDAVGPFGTPITDSERVAIRPGHRRAWLVAYLPAGTLAPEQVATVLADPLLRRIGEPSATFASGDRPNG
jgi:DNA/RNA-binding domain of Phe-tRNA-synthetase-like protein